MVILRKVLYFLQDFLQYVDFLFDSSVESVLPRFVWLLFIFFMDLYMRKLKLSKRSGNME